MKNTDVGHLATELELERLEKELITLYNKVSKEVTKDIEDKLKAIEVWKEANIKLLERNPTLYYQRIQNKYLSIEKDEKIIENTTKKINQTNHKASDIINLKNLTIFAINYNFMFEDMNKQVDFTIKNPNIKIDDVKKMLNKNKNLIPQMTINDKEDFWWNEKKIKQVVEKGISQGKGTIEIGKDLTDIVGMNKSSQIRNAKSYVTETQNKARYESRNELDNMGVIYKRQWHAKIDDRTRDTHKDVDRQFEDENGYFKVGRKKMLYPGDKKNGGAENFYNCRCYVRNVYQGINKEKMEKYVSKV